MSSADDTSATREPCGHPTKDGGECQIPEMFTDGKCFHHTDAEERINDGQPTTISIRADHKRELDEILPEHSNRGEFIMEAVRGYYGDGDALARGGGGVDVDALADALSERLDTGNVTLEDLERVVDDVVAHYAGNTGV